MIIVFRERLYNVTRVDGFEGYKGDVKLYCKWNQAASLPVASPVD